MTIQIRRTATPDNPPIGLMPGQLAVEMASNPPKLWCGVPYDINPNGRVLLGYAGGGSTVFSTGDAKLTLKVVADPGWVMMDDGTIGNDESAATHVGIQYVSLFHLLFDTFLDTYAPLYNNQGVQVARDLVGVGWAWNNGYRMSLTRQLGRAIVIAGAGAGLTNRELGAFFGEETHTPSIAEMINHAHGVYDPTHSHPGSASSAQARSAGYHYCGQSDAHAYLHNWGGSSEHCWTDGRNTGCWLHNTGSTSPFNVMQASNFWNIMMKL